MGLLVRFGPRYRTSPCAYQPDHRLFRVPHRGNLILWVSFALNMLSKRFISVPKYSTQPCLLGEQLAATSAVCVQPGPSQPGSNSPQISPGRSTADIVKLNLPHDVLNPATYLFNRRTAGPFGTCFSPRMR